MSDIHVPAPSTESPAEHQRRRNAELAPIIPERVPWRALVIFLVLAFGLAWLIASPMYFSGLGLKDPGYPVYSLTVMFTPAIAAFIVVVFVARPRSIPRSLGLAPLRPLRRTLGLSLLAVVALPVISFLAMLLGDALGLIELDLGALSGAEWGQLLLIVPIAVVLGVLTFGEEAGWRGWLLPNLLPLGTWPALVISGVVWGLWHAPLILLGYNYGRTDVVGLLLMVGFSVLAGIPLGWLRLRSASLWPPVVGHAAINWSSGVLLGVFAAADTPAMSLYGTLLGWSGWIVLSAVIVLMIVTGQFRRRAEPGLTLAEGDRRRPVG